MRVLGRKTKADILQAAGTARVVIAVFGDVMRCQFEPRRLCNLDELEAAVRAHNFVAVLAFTGVPPRLFIGVEMDHKAKHAFGELVSRLTAEATNSGSFWQPAPRLAQISGDRRIEA
jgi:hypothetical protein